MVKAIFWDNDGVLADTEHLYFGATAEVLAPLGINLSEADYIQLFLIEGRGAWHLAEARGCGPAEIERLRHTRNEIYGRWLAERAEPMAGVEAVLRALHGRYVMGVVTSSRKDHFDAIHTRTGLIRYFDFILTASDYARVKPHPDPYLAAIARAGVPPAESLAIEDSARGLDADSAAGIPCVVVPTRLTRGCDFRGAHAVVPAIQDVLGILKSERG
jgi:HAD superfamily hydrolase (TIGR01509 family)